MDAFGKPLRDAQRKRMEENISKVEAAMTEIEAEEERIKNVGIPVEKIHMRGEMTVWERIEYLVDPGTFCPLHTPFLTPNMRNRGVRGWSTGWRALTTAGAC